MGFFNDLGKKATEAYNVTKEKTTKLSGELKLKGKINDCKNKIEEIQFEIGKIVYAEFRTNTKGQNEEEINAKCNDIINLENEIKKAEEDILELKNIKKCISCGAEISKEMEFCSKCGTKQPEIVKEEVKIVVEDSKEEVTQEETKSEDTDKE